MFSRIEADFISPVKDLSCFLQCLWWTLKVQAWAANYYQSITGSVHLYMCTYSFDAPGSEYYSEKLDGKHCKDTEVSEL